MSHETLDMLRPALQSDTRLLRWSCLSKIQKIILKDLRWVMYFFIARELDAFRSLAYHETILSIFTSFLSVRGTPTWQKVTKPHVNRVKSEFVRWITWWNLNSDDEKRNLINVPFDQNNDTFVRYNVFLPNTRLTWNNLRRWPFQLKPLIFQWNCILHLMSN